MNNYLVSIVYQKHREFKLEQQLITGVIQSLSATESIGKVHLKESKLGKIILKSSCRINIDLEHPIDDFFELLKKAENEI